MRKRFRSLHYLLEYQTSIKLHLVKSMLFDNLKISALNNCKFLFTVEKDATNQPFVIALISFTKSMDFYESKFCLHFEGVKIPGVYRSITDPELAMRYLLKQAEFDNILTNMEDFELTKHRRFVKSSSKVLLSDSIDRSEKITPRQSAKIQQFIILSEYELNKTSPDLLVLKRFIGNVTNYYSKGIEIPESLHERFQKVKKLTSRLKKELRARNK